MLHSYVERVWSFGYLFHGRSFIIDQSTRKKKKKKDSVLFIISFFIGHVYGRARLLHWVYVLERVRMRASFWDSILVYFGWEYELSICFLWERRATFSLVSLDLYSIHHFIYFGCDYFPCFDVGLPSLIFLSFRLLPSLFLILFFRFTLPHLISFFYHFALCLTWDWYTHIILVHSMWPFIYHHFSCGDP